MFYNLPIVLTLAMTLVSACQSDAKKEGEDSKPPESAKIFLQTVDSDIELKFDLPAKTDPYVQTFGEVDLVVEGKQGSTLTNSSSFNLSTVPFAYFTGSDSLNSAESDLLEDSCKNLALVDGNGNSIKRLNIRLPFETSLTWRSHIHTKNQSELGKLMIEKGSSFFCGIRIVLQDESAENYTVDIVLNPSYRASSVLPLTNEVAGAVEESLIMIDSDYTGRVLQFEHKDNLIRIRKNPVLGPKVPAIKATGIEMKMLSSTNLKKACAIEEVNTQIVTGKPDQLISFSYNLSESLNAKINEVELANTSGTRSVSACNSVNSSHDQRSVALEVSCSDILNIVNLSSDSGCGFDVIVENNQDPVNSVRAKLTLSNFDLSGNGVYGADPEDQGTPVASGREAYSAIPLSDDNPVRSSEITMVNFSENRKNAMARSFDLWLDLSRETYDQYFVGNVRRIEYGGRFGSCARAGGYAYLDSDFFTHCEYGGLDFRALNENTAHESVSFRAVTTMHESLHAYGRDHDNSRRDYAPCKGSSESAVIHKEVATCKKSYCQFLKDSAVEGYVIELNYSIGDSRRFEGLCQEWNEEIGLSKSSF